MNNHDFEIALVDAAFALGAERGWSSVSVAATARHARLDPSRARELFPCTGTILRKFGQQADSAVLLHPATDESVKDRLFDILLRRFDFLQERRAGVLALMRHLPLCPPMAVALAEMHLVSMDWLLEGAGIGATGFSGELKKRGLLAVWLYALRVWSTDESPDLAATMAAVDSALAKADAFIARFGSGVPASLKPASAKESSKN